MTEDQKTVEGKDKGEGMPVGIECFVRCVSNKVDTVKDDVRSLCLNFDIHVGGELLGKGNNLNINNLTPADYAKLCSAFGIAEIRDDTPFVATLMTAGTYERIEEWKLRMAKKDNKISEDQTDITEEFDGTPGGATDKQIKYANDLLAKKEGAKDVLIAFMEGNELEEYDPETPFHAAVLTKDLASDLIETLKVLDDIPEDAEEIKEAMEEQAVKMGLKEKGSPDTPSKEKETDLTKIHGEADLKEGDVLIEMADFATRMAGGLEKDVVVEYSKSDDFLYAHAVFKKVPTATQLKSIPKKLKEMTGLDWDYVTDRTFNASNGQLNPGK